MPSESTTAVTEALAEAESAPDVDIADGYRITTVVPLVDHPPKINTYTMPPQDLDEFFHTYSATGEIVVDVRPLERGTGA